MKTWRKNFSRSCEETDNGEVSGQEMLEDDERSRTELTFIVAHYYSHRKETGNSISYIIFLSCVGVFGA